MAEVMWMCSKCNTFNPRDCKCGYGVIEISHFCPIMDTVWEYYNPITEESRKLLRFFCWANNVYWYEDDDYDFYEHVGREEAAKAGCKYIVMNNLS